MTDHIFVKDCRKGHWETVGVGVHWSKSCVLSCVSAERQSGQTTNVTQSVCFHKTSETLIMGPEGLWLWKKMAKRPQLKITYCCRTAMLFNLQHAKYAKLSLGKKYRYRYGIIYYYWGHNSLSSPIIEKISSEERLHSFQRFCKTGDPGQFSTSYAVSNSAFCTKTIFLCGSVGSSWYNKNSVGNKVNGSTTNLLLNSI